MTVLESTIQKYESLGYEQVVTAFPQIREYKTERAKQFINQAKEMDCNDLLFVGKNDIVACWHILDDKDWVCGYEEQRFNQ